MKRTIEDLANDILREDMEDFLDVKNDNEDEDEDENCYDFMGDVMDPPASWVITNAEPKEIKMEMTIELPSNSFFKGCESDHTIIVRSARVSTTGKNIKRMLRGDYSEFEENTDIRIDEVLVDNQKCSNDALNLEQIKNFVFDRCYDGWEPFEIE